MILQCERQCVVQVTFIGLQKALFDHKNKIAPGALSPNSLLPWLRFQGFNICLLISPIERIISFPPRLLSASSIFLANGEFIPALPSGTIPYLLMLHNVSFYTIASSSPSRLDLLLYKHHHPCLYELWPDRMCLRNKHPSPAKYVHMECY